MTFLTDSIRMTPGISRNDLPTFVSHQSARSAKMWHLVSVLGHAEFW